MTYRHSLWFIPLAILLIAAPGRTQTGIPTLVQQVHGSNTLAVSNPAWIGGPNNTYTIYLPNPAQGGNCIIVGMRFDNSHSPSITVTDDKSNTSNVGNVTTDSSTHNKFAIYYALNVAARHRKIQVLLSSSPAAVNFAVEASEFYNVAVSNALDGNSGTTGTGPLRLGRVPITPTTSGDLIYQIAIQKLRQQRDLYGRIAN